MGLFDWLFGKKKSTVSQKADVSNIGADDGQSKYFKDEPKPEQGGNTSSDNSGTTENTENTENNNQQNTENE